AFAVIAAGARGGFRFGIGVTSVSIWLYLSLILVSATGPTQLHTYIMGPAYLAIVGYLVAYLGRLRLNLESKLAALERAKERNEQFGGTGPLVEHVLQLLLEGVRNVRRHAFARAASIEAHAAGPDIQIRIDDDGLGFADGAGAPWSISSRVDQLGGQVQLARDSRAGAHLAIALRTV